ncbi:MAG TPA: hypothetical protein VHG71_08400 [Verrucomicrobiae bacterium]|nr:hypothetical protein [Verrucomicrobiae bacterium]
MKIQFLTRMKLLIFAVIEVALAYWNLLAAVIFAAFVLIIICAKFFQVRKAKRQNPKDFAFAVFSNPSCYRSPRRERLKKEFPEMSDEEIDNWISEFEALQKEIGRLAAAGGEKILGKEFVIKTLREKFPFLAEYGLRRALNQMWHAQFW